MAKAALGALATALLATISAGAAALAAEPAIQAEGAAAKARRATASVGFVPDRLSVAAAADGSVYLADPVGDGQVRRFTADGMLLGAWGDYGRLPAGTSSLARTLATDPAGNVYVADGPSHRLQVRSPEGEPIAEWAATANDIAVDAAGNVYGVGSQVTKFSPRGALLATWEPPEGGFGEALGIAVDPAGGVYVADTYADRIVRLSGDGALVAVIGGRGHGDGRFVFPYDVATDAAGNVYVADTGNQRVQKLSPTGAFLGSWGGPGRRPGRFYTPTSIATDPAGNVYVADADAPYPLSAGGARIQKLTSEGVFLAAWGGAPTVPRPRLRASVRGRTAKRSAVFRFHVRRSGASFVCWLSGERVPRRLRRGHRCASPKRYAGLRPGRKAFSVAAVIDAERSALVTRGWRIVKRG